MNIFISGNVRICKGRHDKGCSEKKKEESVVIVVVVVSSMVVGCEYPSIIPTTTTT